ncbi:MAG: AmmeMemoRadiSam system radical SAM enzyme [Elusimicrobiota bacterium]
MKEALFYTALEKNKAVKCGLCPHMCVIKKDFLGVCNARKNVEGKLYSLSYSKITSFGRDPIEKKPLYHFYPGSGIFSIGSFGCNLACIFCQNFTIARAKEFDVQCAEMLPEDLLAEVKKSNTIGVAYTYNEPLINFEYILDSAKLIKDAGYKNVLVTNGFINEEPLRMILPYIDAANIDLKAFNNNFYKKVCYGGLEPVKMAIKIMHESGAHIELTNLIIPELNDNIKEIEDMTRWIADISKDIPLHFSRYFPCYKCDKPVTPSETLVKAYNMAKGLLNYVYVGNILLLEGQDTVCPYCKNIVIKRSGYETDVIGLKGDKCKECGKRLNIVCS